MFFFFFIALLFATKISLFSYMYEDPSYNRKSRGRLCRPKSKFEAPNCEYRLELKIKILVILGEIKCVYLFPGCRVLFE